MSDNDYVLLRYSYRLYPDPAQQEALARAFGCARVVFNDALAARQAAYAAGQGYIPDAELSAALTRAKRTPERAWLGEVSAAVLQQALADLNASYRNFFDSAAGKRKGPRAGPPRFRSRRDGWQSVRFTANSRFRVLGSGRLRLPKVGDVLVRWSRRAARCPVVGHGGPRRGRPLFRFVRGRDKSAPAAPGGPRVRDRPRPDSLRGARRWDEGRRAEVSAACGEEA